MRTIFSAMSFLALAGTADAATMQLSLVEQGSNVIFSFDGEIDSSGFLSSGRGGTNNAFLANPTSGIIGLETGSFERFSIAVTGAGFGAGGATSIPGGFTGDTFVIDSSADTVTLTSGFTSGETLSGSAVLAGQSIASLGAAEGTYIYTFGNNTATLDVSIALVPLPAGAALLLGALGGLTLLRRRQG